MPAVFTTTSSPPSCSAAESTAADTASPSSRSASTTTCPSPSRPATRSPARAAGTLSRIATRSPAAANRRAMACPIPRAAPVTSTARPLTFSPMGQYPVRHSVDSFGNYLVRQGETGADVRTVRRVQVERFAGHRADEGVLQQDLGRFHPGRHAHPRAVDEQVVSAFRFVGRQPGGGEARRQGPALPVVHRAEVAVVVLTQVQSPRAERTVTLGSL